MSDDFQYELNRQKQERMEEENLDFQEDQSKSLTKISKTIDKIEKEYEENTKIQLKKQKEDSKTLEKIKKDTEKTKEINEKNSLEKQKDKKERKEKEEKRSSREEKILMNLSDIRKFSEKSLKVFSGLSTQFDSIEKTNEQLIEAEKQSKKMKRGFLSRAAGKVLGKVSKKFGIKEEKEKLEEEFAEKNKDLLKEQKRFQEEISSGTIKKELLEREFQEAKRINDKDRMKLIENEIKEVEGKLEASELSIQNIEKSKIANEQIFKDESELNDLKLKGLKKRLSEEEKYRELFLKQRAENLRDLDSDYSDYINHIMSMPAETSSETSSEVQIYRGDQRQRQDQYDDIIDVKNTYQKPPNPQLMPIYRENKRQRQDQYDDIIDVKNEYQKPLNPQLMPISLQGNTSSKTIETELLQEKRIEKKENEKLELEKAKEQEQQTEYLAIMAGSMPSLINEISTLPSRMPSGGGGGLGLPPIPIPGRRGLVRGAIRGAWSLAKTATPYLVEGTKAVAKRVLTAKVAASAAAAYAAYKFGEVKKEGMEQESMLEQEGKWMSQEHIRKTSKRLMDKIKKLKKDPKVYNRYRNQIIKWTKDGFDLAERIGQSTFSFGGVVGLGKGKEFFQDEMARHIRLGQKLDKNIDEVIEEMEKDIKAKEELDNLNPESEKTNPNDTLEIKKEMNPMNPDINNFENLSVETDYNGSKKMEMIRNQELNNIKRENIKQIQSSQQNQTTNEMIKKQDEMIKAFKEGPDNPGFKVQTTVITPEALSNNIPSDRYLN
jgi:hypothetical protein